MARRKGPTLLFMLRKYTTEKYYGIHIPKIPNVMMMSGDALTAEEHIFHIFLGGQGKVHLPCQ
jgi:hypothetical protein